MSDIDAIAEVIPRLMSMAMSCLALQMLLHPFRADLTVEPGAGCLELKLIAQAPGAAQQLPQVIEQLAHELAWDCHWREIDGMILRRS